MAHTSESTGRIPFVVGDTTYYTWYKLYGQLPTPGTRPVIALHGGPGMSHDYMLPHRIIFEQAGIPVIFYDQLGNGESSHIPEAPPTFWTPELFMDELDNLLKHFGIFDDFDLLGNSWGGMLAGQYAATRRPAGLNRLIVSNSPASEELYVSGLNNLLAKFPQEIQDALKTHEEDDTLEAQEYRDALRQFQGKHMCTIVPWPAKLKESFVAVEKNPSVALTMFGPYTFKTSGTQHNWSIVDILHQIRCPTLLIGSAQDTVQPEAVVPWWTRVPKIKWVNLEHSSHLPHFEEPDRYFDVVIDFLKASL
ncbi:proline-specific peptidase [Pluteus cervinus]|uniref:Proline-specific peptidase n=1 Tax=Pluteus cervinus TaxID=181527 RepID=A0ACD3AC33_9AGAR|nr:proline-specific peptidase [Pluteus cervinus]